MKGRGREIPANCEFFLPAEAGRAFELGLQLGALDDLLVASVPVACRRRTPLGVEIVERGRDTVDLGRVVRRVGPELLATGAELLDGIV